MFASLPRGPGILPPGPQAADDHSNLTAEYGRPALRSQAAMVGACTGHSPMAPAFSRIIFTMNLKSAAFFALVGMILVTFLALLGFLRDISALAAGAISLVVFLTSLIHLLASLSLAVFFYVFQKAQS